MVNNAQVIREWKSYFNTVYLQKTCAALNYAVSTRYVHFCMCSMIFVCLYIDFSIASVKASKEAFHFASCS